MTNETHMPEMTEAERQEDDDRAAAETEFDRRREEQMMQQLDQREVDLTNAVALIESEALRLGNPEEVNSVMIRVRALLDLH